MNSSGRRRWQRVGTLAAISLAVGVVMLTCVLHAAPGWQETAPGLEVCTYTPREQVTVTAVRAGAGCRLRVVDAHKGVPDAGERAANLCPVNGAAINASYFTADRTPLGLLVIDGKRRQGFRGKAGWATFLVRDGTPALALSAGLSLHGVTQAVECMPRLVVDGKTLTFKQQPATSRSAVGIDGEGRVILAVTNGNLTLEQWAASLRDDLGCVNALNFDGGPSTQLTVRGRVSHTIPGGWDVPVLLTVTPGK